MGRVDELLSHGSSTQPVAFALLRADTALNEHQYHLSVRRIRTFNADCCFVLLLAVLPIYHRRGLCGEHPAHCSVGTCSIAYADASSSLPTVFPQSYVPSHCAYGLEKSSQYPMYNQCGTFYFHLVLRNLLAAPPCLACLTAVPR